MPSYEFKSSPTNTHYQLTEITLLGNRPDRVILEWPKSGYSYQKALARSDRAIGEIVRHGTPVTNYAVNSDLMDKARMATIQVEAEAAYERMLGDDHL